MATIIQCPSCARRYSVGESALGKQVRCQQCGNVFAATAAATPPQPAPPAPAPRPVPATKAATASQPAPLPESLDLAAVDLARLPPLPSSPGLPSGSNPLGRAPAPAGYSLPAFGAPRQTVSNPSGGPTDFQMRLLSGGMLALGVILLVASLALNASQGVVYLGIVVLLPLTLVLGSAGLVSPNVVRAVGKYGGHLPWHYKAIGLGVLSLAFVLSALLIAGLFLAGFEPDMPGRRNRGPGLSRSQTATVIERIRKSLESSPNANVVRTVTFPVFSLKDPEPQGAAERTLRDVPGYVAGSFQLAADRKSVTFQYRGEKDIAIQYALLLPGPTGIFIEFSPQFAE